MRSSCVSLTTETIQTGVLSDMRGYLDHSNDAFFDIGFDNTCDLSAVLGMLSNSSVFSTMIQNNAKDVRSSVRNEWGHCNFDNWDITKFGISFQQMETLIRSLGLPSPKDTETVQDLKEWEKRGKVLEQLGWYVFKNGYNHS